MKMYARRFHIVTRKCRKTLGRVAMKKSAVSMTDDRSAARMLL
jgi:hypothetical protein